MQTFFRIQEKGIDFESMKNFVSGDGGDGLGDEGGVCACMTVTELKNVKHCTNGDEIIVFAGRKICEIYDGYRVDPVEEIARFDISALNTDVLYDYE